MYCYFPFWLIISTSTLFDGLWFTILITYGDFKSYYEGKYVTDNNIISISHIFSWYKFIDIFLFSGILSLQELFVLYPLIILHVCTLLDYQLLLPYFVLCSSRVPIFLFNSFSVFFWKIILKVHLEGCWIGVVLI